MRAQHQKDLDELNFGSDLRSEESEFHSIVEELRDADDREATAVDETAEGIDPLTVSTILSHQKDTDSSPFRRRWKRLPSRTKS